MDRYVADVILPAPVYMTLGERRSLDSPEYYGCRRGYWEIHTDVDDLGTERPLGIHLVMELDAPGLEMAEDSALNVGHRVSLVLSAFSGSPLSVPRLKHLGRIGASEGLLEQCDYYYLDGSEALPRILLRPYDFEKLLSWFGRLEEPDKYRLELASRWYGMSVGADDVLDGYLAAWIGLESVGPSFGKRVHEHGPKVRCDVCGNSPGTDRDRGDAGIEHGIRVVAPELLAQRSFVDLKNLRNDIAHGLRSAESLRFDVKELLRDLQLSLIFIIITTARPDSSSPGAGRAILPREFTVFPEGRARMVSTVELTKHRPYYGEWLEIQRRYSNQKSRLESDGSYIWGARTGIEVKGSKPPDFLDPERGYVFFERMGRSWQNLESDQELPQIPVAPWRVTTISPAWKRYTLNQSDN